MSNKSRDGTTWNRQSLLERGIAPAISRTAVLPYTDKEPGNLTKKV